MPTQAETQLGLRIHMDLAVRIEQAAQAQGLSKRAWCIQALEQALVAQESEAGHPKPLDPDLLAALEAVERACPTGNWGPDGISYPVSLTRETIDAIRAVLNMVRYGPGGNGGVDEPPPPVPRGGPTGPPPGCARPQTA